MKWACLKGGVRGVPLLQGKVAFCEITNTTNKASQALVVMETKGGAIKAVNLFKGADVNGQKMLVKPYQFN